MTLLLPWVPLEQQPTIFPKDLRFERPAQQDQYVRWWCENRASVVATDLKLRWYPALYAPILGCIIQATDDITLCVPKSERDVAILEEPEHLNWYHHGHNWRRRFKYVVGIAHTNYIAYAEMYGAPQPPPHRPSHRHLLLLCQQHHHRRHHSLQH